MPVSGSHHARAPIDKLATGYAINAPEALGDDLFVVVPSASSNRSHVVAWAPKTPLPVADDACLVAYDQNGNPWVVAWVSDLRVGGPKSITEAMLASAVSALLLGTERVIESDLAKAVQEKLNPSAWTELTLSSKLEAFSGFQTPAVRSEGGKTHGALRGVAKVKAAQELKAGEVLATLPVGLRPPGSVITVNETAGAFSFVTITAAGAITNSVNAPAGVGISLDDLSFNLT